MTLIYRKRISFILVLSFCFVGEIFSQGGMGMGGGPCGGPFPPCPIPLDGGLSLLVIAGAAFGGKKIYDSMKKNPD